MSPTYNAAVQAACTPRPFLLSQRNSPATYPHLVHAVEAAEVRAVSVMQVEDLHSRAAVTGCPPKRKRQGNKQPSATAGASRLKLKP